jgi:hypothetical protein
MRLAIVADVHVHNPPLLGGLSVNGLNERCRKTISVLAAAARFARESSATLVIAGDLFDTVKPSPQMLYAVMAVLENPTWVMPGNHDRVTDAPMDHACAPLAKVPGVVVIDQPMAIGGVVFVPPAPRGTPASEWLAESLESCCPDEGGVLVAHFGIAHAKAPSNRVSPSSLDIGDAFRLMSAHGIRRMFSGDWHERYHEARDGMTVTQIGALVPTGWDNPGRDFGYLSLYDTETDLVTTRKFGGPRFFETSDPLEAAELVRAGKGNAYVKLRAPRGTAVPDGVLFVEDSVKSERSADEVKTETATSVEYAFDLAVAEMIAEPLREEVLAYAKSAWAQGGNS